MTGDQLGVEGVDDRRHDRGMTHHSCRSATMDEVSSLQALISLRSQETYEVSVDAPIQRLTSSDVWRATRSQ